MNLRDIETREEELCPELDTLRDLRGSLTTERMKLTTGSGFLAEIDTKLQPTVERIAAIERELSELHAAKTKLRNAAAKAGK